MHPRTISLTRRIYTPEAVHQTMDTFAEICEASLTVKGDDCILQISSAGPHPIDEFLNYALVLSAQERLA
jgi:hypothetical protein